MNHSDRGNEANDPFAPLFASDLAEQVRETFEELIGFGGSPVAATQETVHRFGGLLNDEQDGPVILIVLAALQLKHGVVFSSIRDAAIEAIDSGHAARLAGGGGGDATVKRQLRDLLAELREALASIQIVDDDEEDDED